MIANPHPPQRAAAIAELRVLRSIMLVFGVAALLFFGLLYSSIVVEADYLLPWWTPVALAVDFGIPVVLAILSRFLDLRMLRIMLAVYAVGFVLVAASFIPVMVDGPLAIEYSPWPLGITAMGSVAAALVWRPLVTWLYLVANIALMVVVRDLASGGSDTVIALQTGFYSLPFSAIFTALAVVTMRNARIIDRAANAAHQAAARAAGATARVAEQARLDAIVHDEVMTVLLYASTDVPEVASSVQRQAKRALEQLDRIGDDDSEVVSMAEFGRRMRTAPSLGDRRVTFTVDGSRALPLPAEVVSAFIEATTEAVRNSIRHGSSHDEPVMVSVRLSQGEAGITVVIADDGAGFEPSEVPPHRLGISGSIHGRVGALTGATTMVRSAPGRGTTVTLQWRQR